MELADIRYDSRGLIPCIAQDRASGSILMLGWANAEAVELTRTTGELHFFSRSRNELWHKGSTSGNVQKIMEFAIDCDADALLIKVIPAGPACHNGTDSCFDTERVSV